MKEYLDDHAVIAGISTTYTLGVQTLNRDTNKIVAFHSKVTPAGAYVNYNAYACSQISKDEDNYKIKEEDKNTAFFKVYDRETIESPLVMVNKRYFE